MGKIRKTEMLSKLSKSAYFDTKWENCDINVVEQADIPHFSKLDNIGTPFIYFIYLFNNLFKVDKFTKIQYIYIYKSSQTNWLIKVNYPILQKKKKSKTGL